jgi:hypothetical protein
VVDPAARAVAELDEDDAVTLVPGGHDRRGRAQREAGEAADEPAGPGGATHRVETSVRERGGSRR